MTSRRDQLHQRRQQEKVAAAIELKMQQNFMKRVRDEAEKRMRDRDKR